MDSVLITIKLVCDRNRVVHMRNKSRHIQNTGRGQNLWGLDGGFLYLHSSFDSEYTTLLTRLPTDLFSPSFSWNEGEK